MKTKSLSNNPTLLSLLKAGATITFPDGYIFRGDPKNNYIDLRTPLNMSDGLEVLNRKGLKDAMNWKRKYFKHV